MRLHQAWALAVAATFAFNGATFAEVTVSHSNDPASLMSSQFETLFGAEHKALGALPETRIDAMMTGPQAPAEPVKVAKAAKVAKTKGADPSLKSPVLVRYSSDWLAELPAPQGDQQWNCLRTALYFEARGEGIKGQFAVAEVILNRVDSSAYPTTICGVVQQGNSNGCQFSYNCDGARDVMANREASDRAGRIARVMMDGAPRGLTAGATHFHTRAVNPNWSRTFAKTASIGAHLFYRMR